MWEGLQPRPEATQICRSGFSRENLGSLEGSLSLLNEHDQFPSPIYGRGGRGEGALGFCTPAPPLYRLRVRFRPYGESLLANAPKGTKRSVPRHPELGVPVMLRSTSLTPSLLRWPDLGGPPTKGHPWPIAALGASMPLNPLHNDYVRPTEGGDWECLVARSEGS